MLQMLWKERILSFHKVNVERVESHLKAHRNTVTAMTRAYSASISFQPDNAQIINHSLVYSLVHIIIVIFKNNRDIIKAFFQIDFYCIAVTPIGPFVPSPLRHYQRTGKISIDGERPDCTLIFRIHRSVSVRITKVNCISARF